MRAKSTSSKSGAEKAVKDIRRANRRKFSSEEKIRIVIEGLRGESTFYKWKSKYGGLEVSDAKRLKALEDENRRLKNLLADAHLDIAMLKDVASKKMGTPAVKREAVVHLRDHFQVSERRACRVVGADRCMVRYRSRRPDNRGIRERLKELSCERRRFGYRRLHILLEREGYHLNHRKLRRLYQEEGLQVRKRGGRKPAVGTRAPLAVPSVPNERWSLDFVSDSFEDGRRFRILCIVDDHSRECLALVTDTSLSGVRLAWELDMLIAERDKPRTLVRDDLECDPALVSGQGRGFVRHLNTLNGSSKQDEIS